MEKATVHWDSGVLEGQEIRLSTKTLGQMSGLFQDQEACRTMNPATVLYRTQWWAPVPEATEGGLFWGTTAIEPGRVGYEYFMTHGHFHAKRERTEFYGTVQGEGMLILMDADRRTWMEAMSPGTLHHIAPGLAHRVANTGDVPLRFIACWPSDAGYDYETILRNGFGARVLCVDGVPKLVQSES